MDFYLSRAVEGRGGWMLSSYPPRRDPKYDKFCRNDGSVVGQMDVGSWFFWAKSDEVSWSRSLSDLDAATLLDGFLLGRGECRNLTTGHVFSLADAEDFRATMSPRQAAQVNDSE